MVVLRWLRKITWRKITKYDSIPLGWILPFVFTPGH